MSASTLVLRTFGGLLQALDVDRPLKRSREEHKTYLRTALNNAKELGVKLNQVYRTKDQKFKTGLNKGRWTLLHFSISTAKRDKPAKQQRAKDNIEILCELNAPFQPVADVPAFGSPLRLRLRVVGDCQYFIGSDEQRSASSRVR